MIEAHIPYLRGQKWLGRRRKRLEVGKGGVELCHLSPALAEPRAGGGPV